MPSWHKTFFLGVRGTEIFFFKLKMFAWKLHFSPWKPSCYTQNITMRFCKLHQDCVIKLCFGFPLQALVQRWKRRTTKYLLANTEPHYIFIKFLCKNTVQGRWQCILKRKLLGRKVQPLLKSLKFKTFLLSIVSLWLFQQKIFPWDIILKKPICLLCLHS